MKLDYYARDGGTNTDGTRTYCSDADKDNETKTALAVEKAWGCNLHAFGPLCPIDRYAIRDGRLVAIVEIKARSHASAAYGTVFLNFRKWLALTLGSHGLGVRAVFVVNFTDRIGYIDVAAVDASRVKIGGCSKAVKSHTDVEPVIEVPVTKLKWLLAQKDQS